MATNYPGALDALTNPTSTDNMATVSHSAQHTNANDAIEAIQAELGINPAGSEATVVARLDAADTTISGKVTGPGSATSGNIVSFDGTSGKLVKDSGAALSAGGALTLSSTISASGLAGSLLSSATPVMNGTAAVGTSAIPSRQDHVHPSDTTKVAIPASITDATVVRFTGTAGVIESSAVTVSAGGNVGGVGTLTTSGKITAGADVEVTTSVRLGGSSGPLVISGSGAPSVSAPVGSLYLRTDGGADTTLYVKESGTGSSGWIAK